MTPSPSPDAIQFCEDLKLVAETLKDIGAEISGSRLCGAVIAMRENEAHIRVMVQTPNLTSDYIAAMRSRDE